VADWAPDNPASESIVDSLASQPRDRQNRSRRTFLMQREFHPATQT